MGSLAADLEFAKGLAAEAAAIALDRASRISPKQKANESFVTDLDLDLERLIRDRIGAEYPDDALTGEEYSDSGGSGPRRWCIDPIDGTGNLVHGLPLWAVSIGLLDAGEPVLGVIAVPPLRETYCAIKDGGAWLNGERIEAVDAERFLSHDNVSVATNALRTVDPRTVPSATSEAPAASWPSSPAAGSARPSSWASRPTTSPPAP